MARRSASPFQATIQIGTATVIAAQNPCRTVRRTSRTE
jgi:hypothetical protein